MARISIGEAAKQYGVSRRTLERWVRSGRLNSTPSPDDARRRLVDPDAVCFLVATMPKRSSKQHSPHKGNGQVSPYGVLPANAESIAARYQRAIDAMLLHIYTRHQQLYATLHTDARLKLTLEELRDGPLGHDLRRLAAIAMGSVRDSNSRVLSAIDSVLQCLFWPPAATDFVVPREFWDTELGKMLNQAKLRVYRRTDLVSLAEARKLLGVTSSTVYRWMDDKTLSWVRDDANGRTWVVRRDVEIINRAASEIAAGRTSFEQALAS